MRRRRVLRRLIKSPLALAGLAVVLLAVGAAVLAPLLAPYAATDVHFDEAFSPPGTPGYLLGTDDLGRDIVSRILYGLRASLIVGLLSVLVVALVGIPLGLIAGYYGLVDTLVSRFSDLVLAFPFLVLAVGLAAIRGPSLTTAAIAIGIPQLPVMVRVARAETLRIKSLDYVAASIAAGAGDLWVLARHVLPGALSSIIVQITVTIPIAIIAESILSFLGLGVQPPSPSLGIMLSEAQQYSSRAPWTAVVPGVAIMVVALAFNLFGDGLRDALDPRSARRA